MSKHKDKKKYAVEEKEDEDDDEDAELVQQLNAAAVEVKHKNPHSESGRAKLPRSMRNLLHDKEEKLPSTKSKNFTTKDLFADDSSSESSDDDRSDNKRKNESKSENERAKDDKMNEVNKKHLVVNEHDGIPPINRNNDKAKENAETDTSLKINKQYAEKYEQVKRKKELHQLTEKYGKKLKNVKIKGVNGKESFSDSESNMDEDDSDEENDDEEDDEAVLLTDDNELAFAKALIAVRKAVAFNGADTNKSNNNRNSKHNNNNNKNNVNKSFGVNESSNDDLKIKNGHCKSSNSEANKRELNNNHQKNQEEEEEDEQPNDESNVDRTLDYKELFAKANFFPPVETQIERNTRIFNEAMAAKRERKKLKFKLADEYRRAVQLSGSNNNNDDDNNNDHSMTVSRKVSSQTADQETSVIASGKHGINENDDSEPNEEKSVAPTRSLSHKLHPQSVEEKSIREAFLSSVQESTAGFEITAANTELVKTTTTKSSNTSSKIASLHAEHFTVKDEKRKLLEEAFNIKPKKLNGQHNEKKQHLSRNTHTTEEYWKDNVDDSASDEDDEGEDDDEGEAFIRDFFVNELWRPENNNDNSSNNYQNGNGDSKTDDINANGESAYTIEKLAQEEADEVFYQNAELWEREFQEKKYRHEEEHELAGQIRSFPRLQGNAAASEGLLRKLDTSRKDARERRKARLLEERQRQVEELKRLKHLKRREIEEQRALIASVAGLQMSAMNASEHLQLEGNVQNAEHTKKLNKHTANQKSDKSNTIDDSSSGSTNSSNNKSRVHVSKEEQSDNQKGTKKGGNSLETKLKAIWSEEDLDAPYDAAEFDKKMAMFETSVNTLEVPELYTVDNLEEAKQIVQRKETKKLVSKIDVDHSTSADKTNSINNNKDKEKKIDADFDSIHNILSSFEKQRSCKVESESSVIDKKENADSELTNFDKTTSNSSILSNPVALLYPELVLKEIEKVSFEQKRALNMISDITAKHDAGMVEETKNGEDGSEETLRKLHAELKQKEQEYNDLHHQILSEHGSASHSSKQSRSSSSMPFRYRSVPPEDFTLSVEEILARDDRQLNMIAPMSCYAAYLDKYSNRRDRAKIERLRRNGFREIDAERHSRRYGDVSKTVILNPSTMSAEEGEAVAERLRKRLRDEELENNQDEKRERTETNENNNNNNSMNKNYGRHNFGKNYDKNNYQVHESNNYKFEANKNNFNANNNYKFHKHNYQANNNRIKGNNEPKSS